MKGPLLPISLVLAVAATAALAVALLRERPRGTGAPAGGAPPEAPAGAPAPPEPRIRAHETTLTLTEDLRDALTSGTAALSATVLRVSARLGPKARWTLANAAPEEASPRVRALLVFAAGVHVPDEELLLNFLGDREPAVRRAAALAAAYDAGAGTRHTLDGAVEVPVGRGLPETTRRALETRLGVEEDAEVRAALAAALSSRRR